MPDQQGLTSKFYVLKLVLLLFVCVCSSLDLKAALSSFAEVKHQWRSSEAYIFDRQHLLLHTQRVDFNVRRLEWVKLSTVSPVFLRILISAEDQRFFQHHGVDWWAMTHALYGRLFRQQQRGASTITMQLVTWLDESLKPKKKHHSWFQKWRQIKTALTLEESWAKHQILEAYVNLAYFRGELQGLNAAAEGLFGKSTSGLSEADSILLTVLLRAPDASLSKVTRRACALAQRYQSITTCNELQRIIHHALERRPTISSASNLAPQIARFEALQGGEKLVTTLDKRLQTLATTILRQQLLKLVDKNVRDGAIVVADNRSGEILAYIGNVGPVSRSALIDGAKSLRQAGSTLKPFLYGLALDQHYLTAASLLDDSPIHLETSAGFYVPQNYDHDFKGLVSVRSALANSLNIPAVRTLNLVGLEPFHQLLQKLGYSHLAADGQFYGFAAALGSPEVSLLEQVNAYRTLANQGVWSPLKIFVDKHKQPPVTVFSPRPTEQQIFTPQTSFIISDILSDRAGRSMTFGLDNPLSTRYWSAVKTGTSKDMRDNWCIGYSTEYTVGVWIGNLEGDSMHDVSGVTGAAPVWLAVMNTLNNRPLSTPPVPAGLINQRIHYTQPIEPDRQEWFLANSEMSTIEIPEIQQRSVRIESPPNGLIIALDPDIPALNQTVLFKSNQQSNEQLVWKLNDQILGSADKQQRWQPRPGSYTLELINQEQKILDTVQFLVKGGLQ